MAIASYDPQRDLSAVRRIWREIDWISSDREATLLGQFFESGAGYVALMDGSAECAVTTHTGLIRYLDRDLDASVVSSVTTSLIGRKLGFGRRLTAHAVAESARAGAAVSILGMFEQGFYDLLGFGSGSYEHHIRFDPASLVIDVPYRPPARLTTDDWEEMHRGQVGRLRSHGGVAVIPPGFSRAEFGWGSKAFGFGYRSPDGELTHYLWGSRHGESGPYRVKWIVYQTSHHLLELLACLEALGDQIRSVTLTEPAHIQLQDLLRHVVRQRIATDKSEHAYRHSSGTWWQARILDVPACVAARSSDGEPVRFVARLEDPLPKLIDGAWPGVGGSYVVTIGETSVAEPGDDTALPSLAASVNAFSRMWLGVRPASSLAVTDRLDAPPELLADLDRAFGIPQPHPGMFF